MSPLSTYLSDSDIQKARKLHADGFGTWIIARALHCTVLAVESALL